MTLVCLCRSQRRKAAAEHERSRFAALREENAALRKEADASAREGFEVAEYLRREILAKDERIAQLEMHIEQVVEVCTEIWAGVLQARQGFRRGVS